ncbi:alpha/beta hydrolase [Chitinophaga pendula]|uniref:alpha/beta fold hydrolase n=1 Tax=Chitinophaga TaxID=79328 RepID=UPI000BAFFEAC|nr:MULTISPECIES: alpha/beta hydrolase [Chitinophaga]ASZ13139.1 alpha/beta hydrolase [Chitinophaga sp. MD30]UCJ09235.1 alpha/beta hydrolase [Chitinophaga pendula]
MLTRNILFTVLLFLTHLHMNAQTSAPNGHYATVNGLKLYYEIQGNGTPLILLHGGGSTISSTFGRIWPLLLPGHQLIGVESQSHGRTADRDTPSSFEQDADDVAALLQHLHIEKADFMGFSNGATTCLQIAIRHPQLVGKLVLCAVAYRRDGMIPGFFEGMEQATLANMPQELQQAYLAVNPSQEGLQRMFHRDSQRMIHFKDIPDTALKAIHAPALLIHADQDVILTSSVLTLSHTLPHARLAVLPGIHGECIGEIATSHPDPQTLAFVTAMIQKFLKE